MSPSCVLHTHSDNLTALHCIALHCTALHYTAVNCLDQWCSIQVDRSICPVSTLQHGLQWADKLYAEQTLRTIGILHSTMHTIHLTQYTIHCVLQNRHCSPRNDQRALHNAVHYNALSLHCTLLPICSDVKLCMPCPSIEPVYLWRHVRCIYADMSVVFVQTCLLYLWRHVRCISCCSIFLYFCSVFLWIRERILGIAALFPAKGSDTDSTLHTASLQCAVYSV